MLLMGMSWALVACFVAFQYSREKQYKADMLDARLQLYNDRLLDAFASGPADFDIEVARAAAAMPGLRVSVIKTDGSMVYDNSMAVLSGENHLGRSEIAEAVKRGSGFTLRRHSSSTDITYFYSATRRGDIVVRTAAPYSHSLLDVLRADRSFLWFMLAVTLVLSLVGYFLTRRIGHTITRLNRFAELAEQGGELGDIGPFPGDELGSISNHIVRLYARLRRAMDERDREHSNALRQEQEKTRIKKQLTNNINHEIKTPVASAKACLETVLDHRDLPPERHWAFIDQCYRHVCRLVSLLRDVAAVTRLDDGSAAIVCEPVDIAELLAEMEADVSPQLSCAGMSLNIAVPSGTVVSGNRSFLMSVFRNIVDNAIAYSGGTTIDIRLTDSDGSLYTFSASDNGCGIPPEHLERIFERFYRIDKGRSRALGGTGLGLSIVRNAVRLHGGDIRAVNRIEGGLRFIFTLAKENS